LQTPSRGGEDTVTTVVKGEGERDDTMWRDTTTTNIERGEVMVADAV
jgi:hypothetical protein